jgi:DNA-binding XRE family transcriptional regulator
MRDSEELRDAMADYRREHDLSLAEAAEKAGVKVQTWTYIEKKVTKNPQLRTRRLIERVLPPPWEPPELPEPELSTQSGRVGVVETIVEHQRERRARMPNPTNRYDLSMGRIKCQVSTTRALPAAAFAVLAELVTVIEQTEAKLHELLGEEPVGETG